MKCDVEPKVAPALTCPGFALAYEIISSILPNGAPAAAPTISGVIVTLATVSKPL